MIKNINLFFKPYFQFIIISAITIFIFAAAYFKLQQNIFLDPEPKVEFSKDKVTKVKVGLNVQNFLIFNVTFNEFSVDLNLWFEFDPEEISLKDIEKFDFSKGEIIEKSEPVITNKNGKTFVRYDIKLKLSSNLNYKYFPLEDHKFFIVLNNKNLDGKKIVFESDKNDISISESLYTPGWKAVNANVKAGTRTINMGKNESLTFPRAVFSIDFMQSTLRPFIFIVLPILIAILIIFCAIAMSWKSEFSTIMGLTVGNLAAIVSYRFVIEKISPRVDYFILSDQIFSFFLILIFLVFFIEIFFRNKLEKRPNLRVSAIMGLYLAVILGWSYLLFIW